MKATPTDSSQVEYESEARLLLYDACGASLYRRSAARRSYFKHLSKTYPTPLARLKSFLRRTLKPHRRSLARRASLEVPEGSLIQY